MLSIKYKTNLKLNQYFLSSLKDYLGGLELLVSGNCCMLTEDFLCCSWKPWESTLQATFKLLYVNDLINVATSLNSSCPVHFRKLYSNKNWLKLLFSHFFAVPQKVLIKLFEAPQRSVKIKNWRLFSLYVRDRGGKG